MADRLVEHFARLIADLALVQYAVARVRREHSLHNGQLSDATRLALALIVDSIGSGAGIELAALR